MSDRRLLPAQLGGGECTVLDGGDGTMAAVDVPGLGAMSLPRAWLEPEPEPEPEPLPIGTILKVRGSVTRDGTILECDDASWKGWHDWGQGEYCTWTEAIERGALDGQRLIPEPDVEWLADQLHLLLPKYDLFPDDCRDAATALLDAMRSRT